MTTVRERILLADTTIDPSRAGTGSMHLVKQLAEANAVAIRVLECFHQTAATVHHSDPVLAPVGEAVKKLISAREAGRVSGVDLNIFACTEARRAVALNRDTDPRDRKYLSGLPGLSDFYPYCGGLDAAISRALIFAPHADVVCFKNETPSVSEAARFATAVRAVFPEKQLAFGYSPKLNGPRWNELDHAAFQSELHGVGFDYYFFTQFGSIVFPDFPAGNFWAMFDDAQDRTAVVGEESPHFPELIREIGASGIDFKERSALYRQPSMFASAKNTYVQAR